MELLANFCDIESRVDVDHLKCTWVYMIEHVEEPADIDVKSSWAPSKVRGRSKLKYTPPTISEGCVIVKIKSSDYLVEHFMGKRMRYMYVKETLKNLWDMKGDFEMSIRGMHNLYYFKFLNSDDKAKVLERGSQHIEVDWKPLFLDKATENNNKRSFARICVEMGADSVLSVVFNVLVDESYTIEFPVKYNWLPPNCSKYMVFGHNKLNCPVIANAPPAERVEKVKVPPIKMKWMPKNTDVSLANEIDASKKNDKNGWESPNRTSKNPVNAHLSSKGITSHNSMQSLENVNEENLEKNGINDSGERWPTELMMTHL
ncbi:hypothetical protein GIB67_011280 [Kingdonia uniflora]|uniref:DUF4283 domain-containing protein n=1 Tax=Kingdonia uniflora TaxID=39325 RepID=A0A7J7MNG8_9MAGN|nr:hypothetical protein GIB67_011280 [Kingdonia uniflora]